MKTIRSNNTREKGSVLVISLSVICLAAILLATYLMIVQNQTSAVSRSQAWNNTIAAAEAGVEEGLALINKGAPAIITSPMAWTNGVTSDGWTSFVNGQITLSRTLPNGASYTVTVSIVNGTPTVYSVGTVPYTTIPWIFSSATGPFLAQLGVAGQTSSTTATMGRKVQIQTTLNSLFTAAVITKSNFNMNGNNTLVDSFDSSNNLYSTLGQYDSTKRKANGTIATDSGVIGDISIGQGNIYGHVLTGPGSSQSYVQVGSQGAVGDLAWNASHNGIESGFWSGDFNVNIPDTPTPTFTGLPLPPATNGTITLIGGLSYTAAIDPGASFKVIGSGTANLWVQGSFKPGGITISNGAALTLFVGTAAGTGNTLDLSGNGTMNQPGYSANLQFYGLPSVTSIKFSGNAGFCGTIYAPEADMTGGGGGNNVQDTSGAMIVKSVTVNGHWNFHYDEQLQPNGPSRGWIPKNWTELKYP